MRCKIFNFFTDPVISQFFLRSFFAWALPKLHQDHLFPFNINKQRLQSIGLFGHGIQHCIGAFSPSMTTHYLWILGTTFQEMISIFILLLCFPRNGMGITVFKFHERRPDDLSYATLINAPDAPLPDHFIICSSHKQQQIGTLHTRNIYV